MQTENSSRSSIANKKKAAALLTDTCAPGKCARCVWGTVLNERLAACAFGRCVQQGAALGRQTWTGGWT